jgi:tRNA-dihydrouridine synthase
MGCPAKDVVQNGAGSGLIRTPELAAEIIAATKEAGLPVSVKTRLGDVRPDEWTAWLTHILKQDVVNLTIHLRTRKEMSKVPAHYELIPEIKKLRDEIAPNTLLTINGDIRDRAHGLELVEKYGVDGVMIGRGVFTNPFAFADIKAAWPADSVSFLEEDVPARASQAPQAEQSSPVERPLKENDTESVENDTNKEKLLSLLRYHLDLFDKYSEELEPRKFDPLKRFFKIYIRDFPGASELRETLMHTKSTQEVREILGK